MFDVIHLFAVEYGWSKRQILEEVYFDEIDFYAQRIKKQNANERLTDLAIEHNPNTKDPKKLVSQFQNMLQEGGEKGYLEKENMTKQDENALKELARKMKSNASKRRG